MGLDRFGKGRSVGEDGFHEVAEQGVGSAAEGVVEVLEAVTGNEGRQAADQLDVVVEVGAVLDADAEIGADVMTGPLSAITALAKHPLTDSGLEKFLADFKKVNG